MDRQAMDRQPFDFSPLDVNTDKARFEQMVQNVVRRAHQARQVRQVRQVRQSHPVTVFGLLRRRFVPAFATALLLVVVGGGLLITHRTPAPPTTLPTQQPSIRFVQWVRGTSGQPSVWNQVSALRRQP
jgi:hypothetical protein